ncbi:uncharacterized protein MONBRDRAFT_38553 [Monosiga brevicollis MX1]|uniref:Uncharacterized protein n=1 Tax=Monosiga brevicollis TaxID=81824 RepID=A9V8P4_MONBE|nr:uncharacterized protein MONBRDRAFT_38553 [Monosiga brevicollis MX1]EDQ86121.1 predicted protein [Monosiga brevicollis MX1]|eukprot:XP_001749046.1 hypothetical protein [Monosiga brevicollis MX1]
MLSSARLGSALLCSAMLSSALLYLALLSSARLGYALVSILVVRGARSRSAIDSRDITEALRRRKLSRNEKRDRNKTVIVPNAAEGPRTTAADGNSKRPAGSHGLDAVAEDATPDNAALADVLRESEMRREITKLQKQHIIELQVRPTVAHPAPDRTVGRALALALFLLVGVGCSPLRNRTIPSSLQSEMKTLREENKFLMGRIGTQRMATHPILFPPHAPAQQSAQIKTCAPSPPLDHAASAEQEMSAGNLEIVMLRQDLEEAQNSHEGHQAVHSTLTDHIHSIEAERDDALDKLQKVLHLVDALAERPGLTLPNEALSAAMSHTDLTDRVDALHRLDQRIRQQERMVADQLAQGDRQVDLYLQEQAASRRTSWIDPADIPANHSPLPGSPTTHHIPEDHVFATGGLNDALLQLEDMQSRLRPRLRTLLKSSNQLVIRSSAASNTSSAATSLNASLNASNISRDGSFNSSFNRSLNSSMTSPIRAGGYYDSRPSTASRARGTSTRRFVAGPLS